MTRIPLQAKFSSRLQRKEGFILEFNLVKKLRKFFSLTLTLCLTAQPLFAAEFVPPQLGMIVESFGFKGALVPDDFKSPVIIHIQDAHDSYPIQRRMASLIEFLVRRYRISQVFEEGNAGFLDTSKVFWVANRKFVEQLAHQFLQERKITGPEFAHLIHPGSFKLYGAEDESLYKANVQSLSKLAFYKSEIENQLRGLEKTLKKQIPRVLTPELQGYYRKSENFWNGLSLPPFRINWKKDLGSYHQCLEKLHSLDRKKLNSLVTSARQKELVDEIELFSILRKISRLKATREDIEIYRERMTSQSFFRDAILLKEFFDKVLEFYDLARQRDLALVRNTLEGMARNRSDRAILVSGGFHTRGISQFLRDHGISYVVVAPISRPVLAETLREPNLFNLPFSKARLFFDLRGMSLADQRHVQLYHQLRLDAERFWKRGSPRTQNRAEVVPARLLIQRGAVVLFTMTQASSDLTFQNVLRWMNEILKASSVEFVIAVSRKEDVERIGERLKRYLPEVSRQPKIRIIRLLTPQDFGATNRLLYGKFVFLIGNISEQERLKLLGLTFDHFLPLSSGASSDTEEKLFNELYQLQQSYRAIIISS